MNKKRLIITSIISILLVSILMKGSTYSIFTISDVDEDTNVYTTGNLSVTYALSEDNIKLENSIPMSDEEAILDDTTAGEVINHQYIMIRVGKLTPKSLLLKLSMLNYQ